MATKPFSRIKGAALAIGMVLAFATTGAAYIPPTPFLLQKMIDALGQARAIQVEQHVRFFTAAAKSLPNGIPETLVYRFPDAFQEYMHTPQADRVRIFNDGDGVVIQGGTAYPGEGSRYDRYSDILLFRSVVPLTDALTRMGIDVSLTALGRFFDHHVVIIGALNEKEDRPQLWIDKSSNLPLRLILTDARQPDQPFEIQFRNWQSYGNTQYPDRIDFYDEDVISREIVVDKVSILSTVDASLFDIQAAEARYVTAPTNAAASTATQDLEEVDRSIEQFRQQFGPVPAPKKP